MRTLEDMVMAVAAALLLAAAVATFPTHAPTATTARIPLAAARRK